MLIRAVVFSLEKKFNIVFLLFFSKCLIELVRKLIELVELVYF